MERIDELSNTERFSVMSEKYRDLYERYDVFAQKIGAKKSAVNNWERRVGKSIRKAFRAEICKVFKLQHTVWSDSFDDEINFFNALHQYELVGLQMDERSKDLLEHTILGRAITLTGDDEERLAFLHEETFITLTPELLIMSSPFLFELAKLLKEKNQINDALAIIKEIQSRKVTFKYYYHNQLEHFKAVLLSHNTLRHYDEAIDILRTLYSASHYHLQEPEIITLMASNYKRKALSHADGSWCSKEEVDTELLLSAATLYAEAYSLKDVSKRYYDAINLAYMYRLLEHFANEPHDISTLYKELTLQWRPDPTNWWEVSVDAEFELLMGNGEKALKKIGDFMELESVSNFQLQTLLRQLEMHVHFSGDTIVRECKNALVDIDKGVLK